MIFLPWTLVWSGLVWLVWSGLVWSGLVIIDILELPAFRKYSICWVFYALCICLCLCLCLCICHHYMIEDIVLITAIFHMRGLT